MRPIKFRVWDGKNKHMWNISERLHLQLQGDSWKIVDIDIGSQRWSSWNDPHIKLLQYTGLKDKNGKEIYENDKVAFTVFDCFDNDKQYEGFVVYSGSRFMVWNKLDDEYYGSDGGFDLDWVVSQDCEFEIIENPELLEAP